jgi:hypothetical protein
MDAVHAWDQQDIHFYVPHWIDHSVDQVIRYQTSLRGALPRRAGHHCAGEVLGAWGRHCAGEVLLGAWLAVKAVGEWHWWERVRIGECHWRVRMSMRRG